MSDHHESVTAPSPEREELIQSVFRWSPLEEVAQAVSVATESFQDIYVERRCDQWRWSLATKGGAYPLLRITAKYLRVDHLSIVVGFREVGDGWCVLQIEGGDHEVDAWAVLRFEEWTSADQVDLRVLSEVVPTNEDVVVWPSDRQNR